MPESDHFNQRGDSLNPQKALATRNSPSKSAAALPLPLQARQARLQRQEQQLQKYLAAALQQPAWRRPFTSGKPSVIYLPAGNNVAWFPGLQRNEANLSSHPVSKIYLHLQKKSFAGGRCQPLQTSSRRQFNSDRQSQPGARDILLSKSVLQWRPDAANAQTHELGTSFQKTTRERWGGHLYRTTDK